LDQFGINAMRHVYYTKVCDTTKDCEIKEAIARITHTSVEKMEKCYDLKKNVRYLNIFENFQKKFHLRNINNNSILFHDNKKQK